MAKLFISYSEGKFKLGQDLVSVLTGEQMTNEKNSPIEYYAVLNKGNARLIPLNILIFAANDLEALTMLQEQGKRERCKVTLFNRKTFYSLEEFAFICKTYNSLDNENRAILTGNTKCFDDFVTKKLLLVAADQYAKALDIAKNFGFIGDYYTEQLKSVEYYNNL